MAQNNILYAFYDLSVSPTTFDIAVFLIQAEIYRRQNKISHLHLVIVPGPEKGFRAGDLHAYLNTGAKNYDYETMRWRLNQILVPCARLLHSCSHITVCRYRAEAHAIQQNMAFHVFPASYSVSESVACYNWKSFLNASSQTDLLPSLNASGQAQRYVRNWIQQNTGNRKLIIITLRESSYQALRNSDLKSWCLFADRLNHNKFLPVFIRDADTAFSPLPSELKNRVFFNEAIWNLDMRAALYEQSYLNMFVNNGPATMCAFIRNSRFLIFKMITPDCGSTSKAFFLSSGIKIGSQLKHFTPFQKWMWKDDYYDFINEAFYNMISSIETYSHYSPSKLIDLFSESATDNNINTAYWISSIAVKSYKEQSFSWLLRAKALKMAGHFSEALDAVQHSFAFGKTSEAIALSNELNARLIDAA